MREAPFFAALISYCVCQGSHVVTTVLVISLSVCAVLEYCIIDKSISQARTPLNTLLIKAYGYLLVLNMLENILVAGLIFWLSCKGIELPADYVDPGKLLVFSYCMWHGVNGLAKIHRDMEQNCLECCRERNTELMLFSLPYMAWHIYGAVTSAQKLVTLIAVVGMF